MIDTFHTTVSPPLPSSPTFHFQLTRMTNTLLIWVGVGSSSSAAFGGLGGAETGADGGADGVEKNVAKDWAVAMPSYGSIPETATPLFRPARGDVALPMSRRLARRFPSNQVHLSLSLPSTLTSISGPDADPNAAKSILFMEKQLAKWLDEVVSAPQPQ